jgi:hypothetical protein
MTDEQLAMLVVKAERARDEVKHPVVLWEEDTDVESDIEDKHPSDEADTASTTPPALSKEEEAQKAKEEADATWLGKIVSTPTGRTAQNTSAYAELRPRNAAKQTQGASLVVRVSINNQSMRDGKTLKGGIVMSMKGTAGLQWIDWYSLQDAVEEARERLVPEQIKSLRAAGRSWMMRANMPEAQKSVADALAQSATKDQQAKGAAAEERARLKALDEAGALPPGTDTDSVSAATGGETGNTPAPGTTLAGTGGAGGVSRTSGATPTGGTSGTGRATGGSTPTGSTPA